MGYIKLFKNIRIIICNFKIDVEYNYVEAIVEYTVNEVTERYLVIRLPELHLAL